MKKALLIFFWLLLSIILPACETLTENEKQFRRDVRETQRINNKLRQQACTDSGMVWIETCKWCKQTGKCVTQDEMRRVIFRTTPY